MKICLNKLKVLIVIGSLMLSHSGFTSKSCAQINEMEKIELLVDSVRQLKEVRFYRNGFYYSPSKAVEHLQQKRKSAGKSVKTAREFIDKIASKSSTSGKPYKIVFQDGREMALREFLQRELEKIE